MKTQVRNGPNKLFCFWGETIDMPDQSVFTLNYLGLCGEEGKKKHEQPAHRRPEVIRSFCIIHYDGPPISG